MKTTLLVATMLGIASVAGAQDAPTPATLAQGKAIFEGRQAGALCFTCHGMDGKGVPGLAPNLTDAKWLHGDGGVAFLQKLIREGVPKPKEAAAPMLPMGGAKLSDDQIQAVASYVASLAKR